MKGMLVLLALVLAPAGARAGELAALAFTQRPGAPLPLDAPLVDETGAATSLRGAAGGLPLVIVPGYFRCPNLCGTVRADALSALARSGLTVGRDYALAAVTIDPAEAAATAAEVRRDELARYALPGDAGRVHYLTGPAASLGAVAEAEGFHARYDAKLCQFMHPAGLVVATPGGTVSGYVLGVGFAPDTLAQAVAQARRGGVSPIAQAVLLLCFHFDETTGRYTPAVMKLLRLGGGITVLTLGGVLWLAHRPAQAKGRAS